MNTVPKSVLITRLSHIGDCILTLPLANALRDAWPGTRLSWVVEPPTDQLLRGHPAIDEVLVAPRGWWRSWRGLRRLRTELRALGPDLVFDPQSLTKSAILGWLSGAPHRVGFAAPVGGELAPWLHTQGMRSTKSHLLERTLQLLSAVGVRARNIRFDLKIDSLVHDRIRSALRARHLLNGYFAINPGGSWASKRWPPDHYAVVARHLGQRYQLPSLVTWAGAAERGWGEVIVERAGGYAVLAPPTDLSELAALLQGAKFFLGSDTGPMHLAAALNTPCVALFGPTRPEESGPWGTQHLCLQAYYQAGSRRARRRGTNQAMRAIEVQSVIDACESILKRPISTTEERRATHVA